MMQLYLRINLVMSPSHQRDLPLTNTLPGESTNYNKAESAAVQALESVEVTYQNHHRHHHFHSLLSWHPLHFLQLGLF